MKKFNYFLFLVILFITLNNASGIANVFLGTTALFSPLLLITLILLFINNVRQIRIQTLFILPLLFLGTYLFFGSLSAVFLGYPVEFIRTLRGIITTIIIFISVYTFLSNIHNGFTSIKLLNIIYFFLIVSTLLVIVAYFSGFQEYGKYAANTGGATERYSGVFKNPNQAGAMANYCMVFSLYFFMHERKISKQVLLIVMIFTCFTAAYLSFSKTALITSWVILGGFLLAFSYTIMMTNKRLKYGRVLLLSFTLFYLVFTYYTDSNKIIELTKIQENRISQVNRAYKGEFDDEVTSGRVSLITYAWELISSNPFFGYGLGYFHRLPGRNLGAHNTYLTIWGEAGIMPFLLYLVLLFVLLVKSIKIKNFAFLLIGILAIFFIQGGSKHTLIDDRAFNILLVVIVYIIEREKNNFKQYII